MGPGGLGLWLPPTSDSFAADATDVDPNLGGRAPGRADGLFFGGVVARGPPGVAAAEYTGGVCCTPRSIVESDYVAGTRPPCDSPAVGVLSPRRSHDCRYLCKRSWSVSTQDEVWAGVAVDDTRGITASWFAHLDDVRRRRQRRAEEEHRLQEDHNLVRAAVGADADAERNYSEREEYGDGAARAIGACASG